MSAPSTSPDVTIDVNKIAANVLIEAGKATAKNAGSFFKLGADQFSDIFTRIYRDYLVQTYKKVSTIKTFINPQVPVDLYRNFVQLNLKSNGDLLDETDLIDLIRPGCRIVVSALAGRGKSVLMKYVALTRYHVPNGTIPLFLELRSLNSLTTKDILSYLHNTYKGNKRLSFDKFLSYLKSGTFLLVLDGFDEVDPDFRDFVEDQIISISRDYEDCSIIVSGRPDEKFNSWNRFTHYTICPMTLPQVESLVAKIEYNKDTKAKFLKQVRLKLYQTHTSFLSTPLLSTLMLLTFEQYADIPDKLHIFYDNAFETLFRKHDAMKEQYVRSTRAKLPVDLFRKVFSAFCAITYSSSSYQFSHDQVISDISKALNYCGKPCSAQDFLTDLVESVCLLQLEGFEYHFVHRSFQEYFCALFLAQADDNTRIKYMNEAWNRLGDNVLPMLFDMAQDAIEREWVPNAVARCVDEMGGDSATPMGILLAEVSGFGIRLHGQEAFLQFWTIGPRYGDLAILRSLYPAFFKGVLGIPFGRLNDKQKELAGIVASKIKEGDKRFVKLDQEGAARIQADRDRHTIEFEAGDEEWLGAISLLDDRQQTFRALEEIRADLKKRSKSRMSFLDDLF